MDAMTAVTCPGSMETLTKGGHPTLSVDACLSSAPLKDTPMAIGSARETPGEIAMVAMTADGAGQQVILQRVNLLKVYAGASLRNVNLLTVDSVAPFSQTNAALTAPLANGLGPPMMTPSGNPRRQLAGARHLPSKR